jgi:hypothetical protein
MQPIDPRTASNYTAGAEAVYRLMGLKPRAKDQYLGPDGERLTFGKSVRRNISRQLIGEPREFFKELAEGRAFRSGSRSRNLLWATTPLERGAGRTARALARLGPVVNYAPALTDIIEAVKSPEGERSKAWGGAVGSVAGSVLGAPLGLLGTLALSEAGRSLGKRVGGVFDRTAPQTYYHDAGERSAGL